MKIPMKVDYAVRAMLELADTDGGEIKQSSEIAQRWDIPAPYLDQLLTALRKAGLVYSIRGPQGGHALARPACAISVNDIFEALEGPFAPADCMEGESRCGFSRACAIQDLWAELQDRVNELLRSVTIEDLARKQASRAMPAMYYI
ncbi:MAG: RrF2 family transcriptional regulator [Chloroflexota bacterium]